MSHFKRLVLSALFVSLSTSSVILPSRAQSAPAGVKNVVLVHGAFADGSSWAKIIPVLQAQGFRMIAVQNPLTSRAVAAGK